MIVLFHASHINLSLHFNPCGQYGAVDAINYSLYRTGDWKGFVTCNRHVGNVDVTLRSLACSPTFV